ncbi:hypothetical protein HDV64DRAFT_265204 [Trichoderma sp. TUCIM 5745]
MLYQQKGHNALDFGNYTTVRSSLADLLALGTVMVAASCSSRSVSDNTNQPTVRNPAIVIPYRAGRVDATSAGAYGVPEPYQDIGTI